MYDAQKSCSDNFMCVLQFGTREDASVHFFRNVMMFIDTDWNNNIHKTIIEDLKN